MRQVQPVDGSESVTSGPASDRLDLSAQQTISSLSGGDGPAGIVPGKLLTGSRLAGRWVIEALLGRGGMGEVYRARDTKLDEVVALKVLPETARDPIRLRLFLDEVRVARQITHPNVCRVHDVGEVDDLHFMTMELIEGEDLGRLLLRSGPLPLDRAAEIGRQVCDGLAAAHDRGIVHRDIKPANLLIDEAGNVRLADFGLAGLIGSATTGGTPSYMAPELFQSVDASVQSDLWAVGLVLYQMYTGEKAFPTGDDDLRAEDAMPRTPSSVREGIAPAVDRVILRCLERDSRRRPRSARAVAAALAGHDEEPRESASDVSLRPWPSPELPAHPYPLLLPYEHPDLLAGRERDVARLERLLRSPVPIHSLSAASGTGKSSLLLAGLIPRIRASGRAVAIDRHPAEPGLAGRLIGDLLEAAGGGGVPVADRDVEGFLALLADVETLAGTPPILVLDQLEEVLLRPEARPSRAALGVLLAATCRSVPGRSSPVCRWFLAYPEEYHGDVVAWLADATADARADGVPGLAALPHDLSTPDRFSVTSLTPLGAPVPGSRDPLGEATAVFQTAIEAPLALTRGGRPRYPWRFSDGGAERLACAFGEARLARPDAPLAPELQVVLAHLLAGRNGDVVPIPEDPSALAALIDRALEDHLRRAFEAAFPPRPGAERDRARALLALRELAGGLAGQPAARIESAVGSRGTGAAILERLAAPDARLVVRVDGPSGPGWALAHDRMAAAIARLVDDEGRGGALAVDGEVLALRQLVAVDTALHARGETTATELSGRRLRQIASSAEALLWDEDRRTWWAACRERRRAFLRRRATWGAVATLVLVAVGLGIAAFEKRRAARRALLEEVEKGMPRAAFAALERALGSEVERGSLVARLARRKNPLDVLESGMGGIPDTPPGRRSAAALDVAELALPMAPADSVRLASLLWALDHVAPESPRAARIRERALAQLRHRAPPPAGEDRGWAAIPGGTFWMGLGPADGPVLLEPGDSLTRHPVTVSAFRMLDHEVTNAEYRRLVPDHPGPDDLPVTRVTWYEAYVYSAWLGGRLPTEAEWEHAARAGCEHAYCGPDGREAGLDEIAWWVGNSGKDENGKSAMHPVRQKRPNAFGLHDMLGNAIEWTADFGSRYSATAAVDPRGPASADDIARIMRGGSCADAPVEVHPAIRTAGTSHTPARVLGFRPVQRDAGITGRKPAVLSPPPGGAPPR